MAAPNRPSSRSAQQAPHSNSDSARWIVGLVLLFAGLFIGVALFSSFFCWKDDLSMLQRSADERELFTISAKNWCGGFGARLGWWLVDSSLGLFGIIVPMILMLLGARIIRRRPLLLNHSVLLLSLVMICGSLTLGFAFGEKWSLCCSSGWGGAFGIGMANLLRGAVGPIGLAILLLVCWILIGVFINRDFIYTVNSAVDRSSGSIARIAHIFRHREGAEEDSAAMSAPAAPHPAASWAPESSGPAAAPVRPQSTSQPAPSYDGEPWGARPQEPAYSEETPRPVPSRPSAAAQPVAQPVRRAVAPQPVEEEDPFEEITRVVPGAEPPAPEPPAGPVIVAQDDEFIEFDLSSKSKGRVVMGRGGLVELDQTVSPAAPLPVVDGPFEEITMAPKNPPAPAPPPTEPQKLEEPADPDEPYLMSVPVARPAEPVPAQPAPPVRPVPSASAAPVSPAAPAPQPDGEGVVVTVETHEARLVDEHAISTEAYDPLKDLVNYRKPPVTLLEDYVSDSEVSSEEIFENKSRIEETLKYFGIPIQRIKATVGPTVTLYEIVQAQGVKISKIQGLENDIAQSLKALGIRIIAPIPGKGTIGIEVPNRDKQVVSMYSAVRSVRFQESKAELPVVIGRTIQNENYVFDLAKMPHLLVAGATGQGKSVGLNAIITSLLYRKHPAQLKFVMIDPKMVEFSLYAKLERHFLAKMESEEKAIITDPMKAVYTLNSLCTEMDKRLELCSDAGARNIVEYNEKFTARRLNPQKGHHYMPYIVVVVDEFADLIMMAREVERPVMRLAQKARAVGIHLIIATQRPDVKVITGGIKANFPARIAFRVMQMIDSRTIIDQPGANQLIGRGDMLFSKDGELVRIQCALVETRDVERVVEHIARQQGYPEPYSLPDYVPEGGDGGLGSEESAAPVKYDVLFAEIARSAVESGSISTSMIQRNYEVGFNRAGRIMMQLERAGIVGRQVGAKPRDILFHDSPSLEAKLQELGVF